MYQHYSKLDLNVNMETGEVTSGGREDAGRGLSSYNKVTGVVIRNRLTGELLRIDKEAARISRMQRRVHAWARALDGAISPDGKYRMVMQTLTYKELGQWKPGHIREYIRKMRRFMGDNLGAYAWVAELQRRGAVHYHVLLVIKKSAYVPHADRAGWWLHGLSSTDNARSIYYIVKYTGKEHQKRGTFPKGMRMFAVWLAKNIVDEVKRWFFKLSAVPAWLRERVQTAPELFCKAIKRSDGGRWFVGERSFRSPFSFVGIDYQSPKQDRDPLHGVSGGVGWPEGLPDGPRRPEAVMGAAGRLCPA